MPAQQQAVDIGRYFIKQHFKKILITKMGLTLQFTIGDKRKIIKAAKKNNFDFFDNLGRQNRLADFSLHLIPDDLNFLVASATEMKNKQILSLRENLDTITYYFDSEENGAYYVDPIIKHLFSEFKIEDAFNLTKKWFDKMAIDHNENLEVTQDAIDSVQRLILICKTAVNLNLDLVHNWLL